MPPRLFGELTERVLTAALSAARASIEHNEKGNSHADYFQMSRLPRRDHAQ
jgi:hypothetical protein